MDYLERAFDDAKYGWYSKRPYIDACLQSFVDPDMAPPGKHVMSCFVQYAPYELRGSDWDTERQNFGDTVQATLESFFPGFGDLVLHREVVTPLDIERVVGLDRGQHLRRRVPGAADVLLPAGARLEPVPHADRRLLPVRLRHAPGWMRFRWARQAGLASRSSVTSPARGRRSPGTNLRDGRGARAQGTVRPVQRGLRMTEIEAADTKSTGAAHAEPFRFFDNREKYLLFVMTTSEKAEVAARHRSRTGPHQPDDRPALRVFDAGTGNGMVLSQVLRDLHRRLPTVPFFVVGKEVSMEDTRLTLATLPDRLAEHPQSVIVLTNMFYAEAPTLVPEGRRVPRQGALDRRAAEGQHGPRVLPADPRARRPPHAGLADGVERRRPATRCTSRRR